MGCAASRDDAERAVSLPDVNIQHSAAPVSAFIPQPSKLLGAPTSPQTQMLSSVPAKPQKPKQKPSSCDYFDVDALLDSVESGAIAPLRGSWVVKLHEKGGRLKRRQDLPPEAFWSAADLRKAAQKLGKKFGVLFVALSYRWLTRDHPDPNGFHLAIVATVAKLYMGLSGEYKDHSHLVKACQSVQLEVDFALFWDFASLFQMPRSEIQIPLFKQGLNLSNIWYGHAFSVCWMQSELPKHFTGADYETSGWCFVEAAISALVKLGLNRLDLRRRTDKALDWCYGSDTYIPEARLDCVCAGQRLPPPTPEHVKHLLETQKKFTNDSDVSVVANLYKDFFETIASSVESMDVSNLQWGPHETKALCNVLTRFDKLSSIE